jgi:hypothetical protein
MELETDEQGIKYYFIPAGTTLFRGESDPYVESPMRLDNRITFFGFDQDNVEENYGIAYRFVTKEDIKLIALDKNQDTVFYTSIPLMYKRILDVNYGYKTGYRNSVSEKDKEISLYICENTEYDGYACDSMPSYLGGTFHSEAMICLPNNKLSGGEQVTDDTSAERLKQEWRARRAVVKTKQRKSLLGESASSIKPLFDYDDEDKENFKPMSLFGGRKRKTKKRRQTKRRQTKRRRRNTKKRKH